MAGKRPLTGQQLSDFGLFGHLERVVHLDIKVSNRALKLGMAQEQLNRAQVLGASIYQGCLRAAHRGVPYAASSSPIDATQRCTMRAGWRVDTCADTCRRLGNRKSAGFSARAEIQDATRWKTSAASFESPIFPEASTEVSGRSTSPDSMAPGERRKK